MSKILGQLSNHNNFLNRQNQAIKISSNERLLSLSNMTATAQEHQPVNSSETINTSEKISEDDGKVVVENNKRDENSEATKNVEQDAVENNKIRRKRKGNKIKRR